MAFTKQINILGIPFNDIDFNQAQNILERLVRRGRRNHVVVTPNPEGVMQAQRNACFSSALKSADLVLADGTGIYMAAKYLRTPLPGRVRGIDTALALFKRLGAGGGCTVYLLGARPGVAKRAKSNLEAHYPGVKVIGLHHGFFEDDAAIINEINALSPDILLVCTGMPRAEIWAHKNKTLNARLTMCLGGTIDVLAGEVNLAPWFLRKIGLEWLYRLAMQPSRAARMLDIPRFIIAVLRGPRS